MLHKNIRGKSLHAPTNEIVENNTGSTITKLKVVAFDGMGTLFPQIQLASPNVNVNFGIAQEDILSGACGYITCLGFMLNVDTSAWGVNVELYSDASGNLSSTPDGSIVAIVIKSDAIGGVLYVTGVASSSGTPTDPGWEIDGNNGLDENVNYIGTNDLVDFRIRTDSLFRAIIDKNGRFGLGPDITAPNAHFHQKSHVAYTNSGLRQETFSLTTSAATNQIIYSVPINNNSAVKIQISVVGRISDGTGRAAFTRTGLFYREASNVQAQRIWQTDFTDKSDPAFDISYTVGVNTLNISVKSSVSTNTYWAGSIKIESVETDV